MQIERNMMFVMELLDIIEILYGIRAPWKLLLVSPENYEMTLAAFSFGGSADGENDSFLEHGVVAMPMNVPTNVPSS